MKKTLVIVAGPTASGKTRLAIDLALHFNTVILSADSRQFYKELSIGTARPTKAELKLVEHYFIASHSITEPVNAGDFGEAARSLLHELFSTRSVVIMAGGSGLYIDAVINGMDDLPKASPETRKFLDQLHLEKGIAGLQQLLHEKDPRSCEEIDIQNPRRIIRALEVCLTAGKPYSALKGHRKSADEWSIIMTGIELPRETLYKKINDRVAEMINHGLEAEARSVVAFRNFNALQTVGYKEMFDFIDGKITIEQAVEQIAKNTRNYAKRQLTWFRKYNNMIWIQPDETGKIIDVIEKNTGYLYPNP